MESTEPKTTEQKPRYDRLMEISLQRGIVYPASEIYGGIAGFYDYGTVGAQIKMRWEDAWRRYFIGLSDDFYEIQTTNIMPEQVFRASGHLEHFDDPIAECTKCGVAERADHIVSDVLKKKFEGMSPEEYTKLIRENKIVCPSCGGEFRDIERMNLMFSFRVGGRNSKNLMYLRPETAQGPYIAFKREFRVNRQQLPLGLAMIGKAYRNEISPRQGVLRTREFTQAELQIFFDPDTIAEHPRFDEVKDYVLQLMPAGTDSVIKVSCADAVAKMGMPKFYVYHMAKDQQFVEAMGLLDKFRFAELSAEERAFYNKIHWDLELYMPSYDKYIEIGGLHYRTDHDLGGHGRVSGVDMNVSINGKKFVPHVLELSWGVDRNVFGILDNSFREDKKVADGKEELRTYFALPRPVAPYDVAVFPLVKKNGLLERAQELYASLKKQGLRAVFDESASIGRRYARVDEIGVPYAVTLDFDTIEKDGTVTIRERDGMTQRRVKPEDIAGIVRG